MLALNTKGNIGLTAVSIAALCCFVAWGSISAKTKNTRSDADFILHWNGYQGRAILKRLIAEKNTVQLRWILAETKDEYLAKEVAEALEKIHKKKPKLSGQFDH